MVEHSLHKSFLLHALPRVSLVMLTACAGLVACAVAPTQEMSDARQAVQAAKDAGAPKHAPRYLKEAETFLTHAEQKLGDGKDGYSDARTDAVAAKEAALKGRAVAVAIAAAKSTIAEAVAVGKLSPAAETALREAVNAAKSGNDVRAIELAEQAKRQAESDLGIGNSTP